jgi:hypothetical protein
VGGTVPFPPRTPLRGGGVASGVVPK